MKFTHVELQTTQLSAMRDFYAEHLGIPLVEADETTFTLQLHQTQIRFQNGETSPYHVAFNIPQNQFAEGKAWLESRVPLVDILGKDEIHFTAWNAHSVYFYDPAGNIMELIARHDLDNDTNEPFSGKSLLSVSEIGIATDDVRGFVNDLQSAFDVPVYDGEGSDIFSAVGNPDGLLIIVPKGRIWFPETGIPAECCPMKIMFDQDKLISYDDAIGYHLATAQ